MDYAKLAADFMAAYNAKDFDTMTRMMPKTIDFAHYNRGAFFTDRDELMAVFPIWAHGDVPDRAFSEPFRVTVSGNVVIRECDLTGTPIADVPGFAAKGERFQLRLCSVYRFNDEGLIVEWKDHG